MSGPQPIRVSEAVAPGAGHPVWKKAILRWNARYRELERIVTSNTLSPALTKLLQFIVLETLDGRGEQLTEVRIAEKVFNQKDFAPSEKSVVRVEKRRLREKLKDYYEGPGKDDPIVISLGTSFVPVFSPRENGIPQAARRRISWRWAVPVALAVVALAAVVWFIRRPP